jgi:hypothetical protein
VWAGGGGGGGGVGEVLGLGDGEQLVFGDDGGASGADGRAQDGEQVVVADAARGGPLAGEELFEGGVAGYAVGGADEGGAVAAGDADAPVVAGVAGLAGVERFEREGAGGGARCGFEDMCAGGPVERDVHDAGGGEAGVAGEAGADDGGRGAIEADRLVGFGELVGDEEEDGGGLGDEGELFAGGEGDRLGAGEAVLAADGGAEVDAEDVAGVVGGGGDGDRGVGAA